MVDSSTRTTRRGGPSNRSVRALATLGALAASVAFLPACGDGEPSRDATESARTTKSTPSTRADREQPYLGPLTFDWAAGCAVPVTERVTKGGRTVVLGYRLGITAEGDNLVISYDGMAVRTIDGIAPPPNDARSLLAAFRLPSVEVDPKGSVVSIRGMDQLIDDVIASDPSTATAFTPELVALLEDNVAKKYWGSWVGFWAEFESIDEARFEVVAPTDLGGGETYDTRVVVESLGTTADGDAVLRQVQVLEGDDFLRAIGAVSSAAGKELGEPPAGLSGRRTTTVNVTTNPKTLRPNTASFRLEIERTRNGKTESQVETRDWVFDWSASGCPGSPPAG